ncbi:hypothetical protein BJ742DRAFT_796026 [Cladochytrium replicatum]|nr:hypothetical protein BJ742DRAFT_796026 [Cladochytrium replicatum]
MDTQITAALKLLDRLEAQLVRWSEIQDHSLRLWDACAVMLELRGRALESLRLRTDDPLRGCLFPGGAKIGRDSSESIADELSSFVDMKLEEDYDDEPVIFVDPLHSMSLIVDYIPPPVPGLTILDALDAALLNDDTDLVDPWTFSDSGTLVSEEIVERSNSVKSEEPKLPRSISEVRGPLTSFVAKLTADIERLLSELRKITNGYDEQAADEQPMPDNSERILIAGDLGSASVSQWTASSIAASIATNATKSLSESSVASTRLNPPDSPWSPQRPQQATRNDFSSVIRQLTALRRDALAKASNSSRNPDPTAVQLVDAASWIDAIVLRYERELAARYIILEELDLRDWDGEYDTEAISGGQQQNGPLWFSQRKRKRGNFVMSRNRWGAQSCLDFEMETECRERVGLARRLSSSR